MKEIGLIGISHRTAPLEVRERFSFGPEELKGALRELVQSPRVKEGVILSTCNRVEVYSALENPQGGREEVEAFLSRSRGVPREAFAPFLYAKFGEEAVGHLFRVASSLDSMVVGEPQILGQIKEAYTLATEAEAVGFLLHRLFQRAFFVAKRVRTETGIGDRAISVSFVAVELAKKIFGELQGKAVLVVGAGEMCELAAKHLRSAGADRIKVTNRTWQRAVELAEKVGGEPVPFEDLKAVLPEVDIVLSSTGASEYIIRKGDVAWALRERRRRPIFFIDIAVPRDVDPEVNDLTDAYLYDIDDLQEVAELNVRDRLKEAERAEAIVKEEVEKFCRWYNTLEAVPTIVALRGWAEGIRRAELDKSLRSLDLPPRQRDEVEALTEAIVNKLLHHPIRFLKESSARGEAEPYVDLVRRLFGLEEEC